MVKCWKCKRDDIPVNVEKCPTCGTQIGAPNVQEADRPEERAALENRYSAATGKAGGEGKGDALTRFEQALTNSHVVVNMPGDLLYLLLTKDHALYSSYHPCLEAGLRQPAKPVDDKRRQGVDGTIHGWVADHIRYGALSLDGTGLTSYGPYAIRLRDVAVDWRTSFLEENTYTFVDRHHILAGHELPPGYRSSWATRGKLATAKLAASLTNHMTDEDFPRVVLKGDGDRATDSFIEAHIYNAFDKGAFEAVRLPSEPSGKSREAQEERLDIRRIREKLDVPWTQP